MDRGSIIADAKGRIQSCTGSWWAFPFSFPADPAPPYPPPGQSLPELVQADFARAILSSLLELSGSFRQTIHLGYSILFSDHRESLTSVIEPLRAGQTRIGLSFEQTHPFPDPASFRLADHGMPGTKCCLLCCSIHQSGQWQFPELIDLKHLADPNTGTILLSSGLCESCKATIARHCRTDRRYGFGPWPGRYSNEPA